MRDFYIKQLFFALLVLIVCLPLAQMNLNLFKEEPLNGVEEEVVLPKLTVAGLLDRSVQQQVEKWFSRKFGLRAFYVRCNNQIYYSLFGQTPPDSTIEVGKNRQLLEKTYIYNFLSVLPQSGGEEITAYAAELRKAQQILAKQGKTLLLLISPSKVAFLPETIPGYYHPRKRKQSVVYEELIKALDKARVEYVDGRQILEKAKQAENEALFPRGGTHWNRLGAYYVTREILEKVQEQSADKRVPLLVQERKMIDPPQDSDQDLARLLNLLWLPNDYLVPKLEYKRIENAQYSRPKILFCGGSFNWLLIETLSLCNYFQTLDIFYYYSTHYHYERDGVQKKVGKVNTDDWPSKTRDADIIILEMNESVLTGADFIRDLIRNAE